MEYTRLGATGLRVSRLALGCMTYGDPARGLHRWTLDEEASAPLFRQAVELGITFWDTANVYQQGSGEEYVGRAIKRFSRREDIVLATKVSGRMHDGPGGSGLTRPRGAATARSATDDVAKAFDTDADGPIIDAVEQIASERGIPMARVALAWVLRNPTVAAPIIGATKPTHLTDAVAALDVQLTDDEVSRLEAPYVAQAPFWW